MTRLAGRRSWASIAGLRPREARAAESVSRDMKLGIPTERAIDQTLADSFPASDPPSWTLGILRAAHEGGS
jgi:hypothetical protein